MFVLLATNRCHDVISLYLTVLKLVSISICIDLVLFLIEDAYKLVNLKTRILFELSLKRNLSQVVKLLPYYTRLYKLCLVRGLNGVVSPTFILILRSV